MRPQEEEGIRSRLQWMMGLRVLVVTLFLGSYLFVFSAPVFFLLIALTYCGTLIYAVFFRILPLWISTAAQICGDLLLITILVAMTGGIESPFGFLFLIPITVAGILMSRLGALVTASASSILFGLVVDFQYFHFLSFIPPATISGTATFYMLTLNMAAFFAVAILCSNLARSLRHITEKLQETSTNLGELQSFNENVARCMSSGLLTTDMEGKITSFNRAAEEITGFSYAEVQGKSWGGLFPLKEIRDIIRSENQLLSPLRFDGDIFRKDGGHRVVGITVSLLKDEAGQDRGVIGIFQDLTQIKEMETEVKKREKMAMVGELSAGMAHEIRNPLASLSGAMQVLKKELILEGENARLMDIALRETERLNFKITEFLAYARPAPLLKKRCDLHGLLRDTLDLLKNNGEYRDEITIHAQLEGELWAPVDPHQMSQVFWNLALNGLQAMPDGGALSVFSRRNPGPPEEVEIVFRDTGHGIEESLMDKIFVPFFTTKVNGSGLGLPLVHRIVDDHGGRLRVVSKVGKGTEFKMFFSLAR